MTLKAKIEMNCVGVKLLKFRHEWEKVFNRKMKHLQFALVRAATTTASRVPVVASWPEEIRIVILLLL